MNSFSRIKPVYRLIMPPLVGTLVYLAILLAFDSVENMLQDFFTPELLFCIVVSYILLEINYRLLQLFGRRLTSSTQFWPFAVGLVWVSAMLTVLMTSLLLMGYFYWFESISEISLYLTELKIFNGMFLFVTFLFQSHFLGFHLIHQRFEKEMEHERQEKESLDKNVSYFHYMLNPQFLLGGLESILLRLKEKKQEQADEGILLLSEIYRHSLRTQEELVPLQDELAAMRCTETFLNQFTFGHLTVIPESLPGDYLLIPRTLTKILEAIAYSQLSSSAVPLEIQLEVHREQLVLSFPCNFSLTNGDQLVRTLKEIQQQYLWLGKSMKWTDNATFFIHIPLEKPFVEESGDQTSSHSSTFNPA